MNFNQIFEAYYTLYRAEAEPPAAGDEEYIVGVSLANEAIQRWASYESTYWKELFTTLALEEETITLVDGQTDYDLPSNFVEAGGMLRVSRDNSITSRIRIVDSPDAQFLGENARYAYVIGSPATGYTLRINPGPNAQDVGATVDFDYYKSPTIFTASAPTRVTEMANPFFIVHRMLAQRFRASRNPYYNSALRDAEDVLKNMQMDNNSGSWANPWTMPDRSNTSWGQDNNRSFFGS